MLQFIIGLNEKARREKLYAEMAKVSGKALLLVPEQFSFESEKLLGEVLGAKQAQKIEVLSFSRLCNSIFRRFGGLAGDYSDETTKLLLMGAALFEVSDDLSFYQKKIQGASFVQKLVETDTLLKNAAVTSDDLAALAEGSPDTVLGQKASDLAKVFSLYDAMLTQSFLDPLTDLSRAAELLLEHDFFSETPVFLDNFTGFTGSEFVMLRAVLNQSPAVTVSLCAPSLYDTTGGTGLFSKTQRTAGRLEHLAKEAGAPVLTPIFAEGSDDSRPAAILSIEEHFLQSENPDAENGGEVRLISAADPYDEADFIACTARKLAEEGYRWREMAIIARDLAPYRHALADAFRKANVPLYTDEPADFYAHPLSAFLLASLSAVQNRFDPADLLRILKTGLLPVSEEDVAEFENYCFVWNVRGSMFLSDFTGNPKGFVEDAKPEDFEPLSRINAVRKLLAKPLEKLRDRLRDADGGAFSTALYDYLTECRVTEGLCRLYDDYTAAGKLSEAEDLDIFWSALISLLDRFTMSLSGVKLAQNSMSRLFEMALSTAKIGVLPKTLDCVAAGTADRFRPAGIRAVFLIGVCDGIFPAVPKNGGLFSETERRTMADAGLELGESVTDSLLSERMYAYTAFTAASEKVFVTVPKTGIGGEELTPSLLITSLKEAVSPLPEEKTSDLPEEFWLCSEEFAFERLCAASGDSSPEKAALRAWFSDKECWKEKSEKLGKTVSAADFALSDRENAGALFGRTLRLSPTGIETFEKCPFSYFAKAGLSLRKRQKAELSPLSSGSLIHYVLQKIILKHGGKGLSSLSDEALREEIKAILSEYLDSVFNSEKDKSARFFYQFSRMAGFLYRLLRRLGAELAVSGFTPYAFELPLDDRGEVPCYIPETPDGIAVSVCGKIDRVDTLEQNGSRFVRVVDYKTGTKNFSLSDIYYGINLQMLLYLFAICQGGKGGLSGSVPAGVLYMPAKDAVLSGARNMPTEKLEKEKQKQFCMNGLLLNDEAVLRAMEPDLSESFIPVSVTKKGDLSSQSLATLAEFGQIKGHLDRLLSSMAKDLTDGAIGALPYKKGGVCSCDLCDYHEVCRRAMDEPFAEHIARSRKTFFEDLQKEAETDE